MRTLFVILTLLMLGFNCDAQRTTRKNLKAKKMVETTVVCDTITSAPDSVVAIKGYDKPLNSTKETFFATNKGERTIVGINITFNYFDNQNRQLHQVTKTINCSIPPGETRQLSISSWDKQKAFYYYRSPQPRRQATPYKVSHNINFIIITEPYPF